MFGVMEDPLHSHGATRRFARGTDYVACTTQFTAAFPATIMMLSICYLPINIHHGYFALHYTRQHLNSSGIKKFSLTMVLEHVELQRPSWQWFVKLAQTIHLWCLPATNHSFCAFVHTLEQVDWLQSSQNFSWGSVTSVAASTQRLQHGSCIVSWPDCGINWNGRTEILTTTQKTYFSDRSSWFHDPDHVEYFSCLLALAVGQVKRGGVILTPAVKIDSSRGQRMWNEGY